VFTPVLRSDVCLLALARLLNSRGAGHRIRFGCRAAYFSESDASDCYRTSRRIHATYQELRQRIWSLHQYRALVQRGLFGTLGNQEPHRIRHAIVVAVEPWN